MHATPEEIREFVSIATGVALEDCFSILPSSAPMPEHVAHLTSLWVVQAETERRDLLTARVPKREPRHTGLHETPQAHGLGAGQKRAAAAVASRDPLVVVEGAAHGAQRAEQDRKRLQSLEPEQLPHSDLLHHQHLGRSI